VSDDLPSGVTAGTPERPAAPAEDAAQLITIACPACNALLRNVKAEPGASVRCLNCGHRFTLAQASGTGGTPVLPQEARTTGVSPVEARTTGVSPVEARPPSAKPRSAGYWLLRIPPVIGVFAALVITPYAIYEMMRNQYLFRQPLDGLTQLSYLPLFLLGGLAWLFLTRALARVDSGATYLGWRTGAIANSLPPAPGSSLPYIAPVAVVGGVLPIFVASQSPDDMWSVLAGGLLGGGLFYLGFMLEDVRQFCWRQEQLARACCGCAVQLPDHGFCWRQEQLARACLRAAGKKERDPLVPRYCGCLLGGAALLVALAIFMVFLEESRYRTHRESLIPLFFSLGFVGIAWSLYLLGRDWDQAVAWWELAAGQRTTEGGNRNTKPLPASTKAFCMAPKLWAVLGAFWVFLMLSTQRGPSGFGFLGGGCALGAAAAFAFWLSVFFVRVIRWRTAQERYWLSRQPEAKRQSVELASWQRWLVWGTVGLAVIQAGLFSLMVCDSFSFSSRSDLLGVLGFPLLVAMLHYPTMWCALLLREFLMLERFYETRRQALSLGEEE